MESLKFDLHGTSSAQASRITSPGAVLGGFMAKGLGFTF